MLEKIKYRLSDAEFIKRTRVRCIAAMTAVTIAVVTRIFTQYRKGVRRRKNLHRAFGERECCKYSFRSQTEIRALQNNEHQGGKSSYHG